MDLDAFEPKVVDEDVVDALVTAHVNMEPTEVRWVIRDEAAADWCMQRLAEIRARVRQYDDNVTLWQDARERVARAGRWFDERLQEWAVAVSKPNHRTIPLAHGTITTRALKPAVEIDDDTLVVEWAREFLPDAIKRVETVPVSQLKNVVRVAEVVATIRVIDETGEIVHQWDPWYDDPENVTEHSDEWQAKLTDEHAPHRVVVDTMLAAVFANPPRRVPGLRVRPGRLSVTIGEILQ